MKGIILIILIVAAAIISIANGQTMRERTQKMIYVPKKYPSPQKPLRILKEPWFSNEENNVSSNAPQENPHSSERNEALRQGNTEVRRQLITAYNVKSIFEEYARTFTDYDAEVVVLNRTVEFNDIILLKIKSKKRVRRDEEYPSEEVPTEEPKRQTKLSDKFVNEPPEKKIVFVVHALNVIGFYRNKALCYDADVFKLISHYTKHLSVYDLYIMPLANPDGAAAWMRDERWSKNNSPQSACNGVALDRNFDVSWASNIPNSCSPLYAGREAFSELESRAIQEVLKQNQAKIHAFFHVRSASDSAEWKKGEALLYPFGYTDAFTEKEDKFMELKNDIEEVTAQGSKLMKFQCDSMYNWYGESVSGSSVDFAYKVFGVPYAFEVLLQAYDDDKVGRAAMNVVWEKVFGVVFKKLSNKKDRHDY